MARAARSWKTLYMTEQFGAYLDKIAALRGASLNATALSLIDAGIKAETARGALYPGQPKPGQSQTAGTPIKAPPTGPKGLPGAYTGGGPGEGTPGKGGRIL